MKVIDRFKDETTNEDMVVVEANSGTTVVSENMFKGASFVMQMMNIIEKHTELYTSEYNAIESDMLKYAFENIVNK